MSETPTADNLSAGKTTIYQLTRRHKRHTTRPVRSVREVDGTILTYPTGLATAFTNFFQTKYDIDAYFDCVHALANLIRAEIPSAILNTFETPFTPAEIYIAIYSGERNRAPGRDGLRLEFYKATRTIIHDDLCPISSAIHYEGAITPTKNGDDSLPA
jgi:hypothetical protein